MTRRRGLVAAAATGAQVGLAMVATRAIAGLEPPTPGPMTLALLRYSVGCAVLLPLFLSAGYPALARRDRWPVLALGIVQFGLLIALLNAGLVRTPASQSAVLFATFPLMTMGLAAMTGGETLNAARLVAACLSVGGVAICMGAPGVGGDPVGSLLVLAAAFCGAFCAVFYRPYLRRYPTLQIGTVAMLAAVAALVPGAALERPLAAVCGLSLTGWGLVLFIGLSSGAGYLLWLTALRHAGAAEATILLGVSPVLASLAGWAFLGETLTPGFLFGALLVLISVSIAVWTPR